jgi:hypothetical protein
MKIGNTDFNLDEVAKMTRKQFDSTFKGVLSVDLDQAWRELQGKVKSPINRKTKVGQTNKFSKKDI